MKIKKALICGISGQDGAYLAKHLMAEGYIVYGTSRDAETSNHTNLKILGIDGQIKIYSVSLNDFRSVIQVLSKTQPDEIYNLSGQSSVGLSFDQPIETFNSITLGTLNLLEAIRFYNPEIKIYNASSSECFGDTLGNKADENTPFSPKSPYAVAKSAAHWYVNNYREAYKLFACSGILFNHESPLRSERFVTQKIISTVINIYLKKIDVIELGNLDIHRDWGWAPDYVKAMHLMLQQPVAEDYVIATGETHSLKDFVEKTFNYLGLKVENHVVVNSDLIRPTEIMKSIGNPQKALFNLGWNAMHKLDDIITDMVEYKLHAIKQPV